ncbi:MAG: DUF4190 domain-containing protein [Nocardiaceae bacterium]|nr:DUF4190 domain-containing protein [Nocardiaceae bacterium]
MTDRYSPPPPYTDGGPPAPPPQPATPYGPPRPTNILAVLALVFGILGGILAIPFGHIARSQIRKTGEEGNGLALAGLILGYIWLAAALVVAILFMLLVKAVDEATTDLPRRYADYSYSDPQAPTYPQTTATTRSPSTTAPRTPASAMPTVSGTDGQGFLDGTGPRCHPSNPAVAIRRTSESLVVVCETGVGRYYYKGVRRTDGSSIELDDPTATGGGFVAVNGKVRYVLGPNSLAIMEGTTVLANEPMLAYWSR